MRSKSCGACGGISCPLRAPFAAEWVFPDRASYAAYTAENREFGERCTTAAGPLAGRLNSWQIARDMEAIRAGMDQPKLHYYGNSHGTVLGQAYAEFFPTKVGRMYLDSVMDHTNGSVQDWLTPRATIAERNLHRFAAWCTGEPTCALHGRDAVAVWDEVIVKAEREPIPAPEAGPGVTVSASLIVSRASLTNEGAWARLATALARADAGDASLFAQQTAAPDPDLSRIALCADFPYPANFAKVKALETQLRKVAPHIGWRTVWRMANHCGGLPATRTFSPHPIAAAGLPPVLISNGEYDDNTPPADGRRLAAQLPRAHYLPARGGHALYLSGNPCVRAHVHRYMVEGQLPPAMATCGDASSP